MISYPKTYHLYGSKGVEDLDNQIQLSGLDCDKVIIEEKVDGAEVSIGFTSDAEDYLRNRNSPLVGPQFDKFYQWYYPLRDDLFDRIQDRFVLFGEWTFAKHSVFYDKLPSYFLAFDVYDHRDNKWLTASDRKFLLDGLDIYHVPILFDNIPEDSPPLNQLIKPSVYQTENMVDNLKQKCSEIGYEWDRCKKETDLSGLPEGLYIKTEKDGETTGFYKYIREGFLRTILDSNSHWRSRKLISNITKQGGDL